MDITAMVNEATGRAHRALCVDPENCSGPTEVELMITACVLESTLPKILSRISLELKQALHAMAAGQPEAGEPDALAENPDELLRDWFRWYATNREGALRPVTDVDVRTAAYLAAREVTSG